MDLEKGYHFDQGWMDLVPCFYDDVFVLRDKAYNFAYWNLLERGSLARKIGDDKYVLVNNDGGMFFCFAHQHKHTQGKTGR